MERYLNRKTTRWIYYKGVALHLQGWADALKINRKTLGNRLNNLGWSISRSLTEPVRRIKRRSI